MPITTDNVKLMASQRLADTDDGGGFMTGKEIVDGNINNLFADISRLDRAYGRVSLREVFLHVDTPDTETYSGAQVILSAPAKDENVGVALFSVGEDAAWRRDARNRLESYVTLGPRFQGWLWGDQPAGAKSLLILQPVDSPSPEVGAVLCLFEGKGSATEFLQYVRVMKVESKKQTFQLMIGGNIKEITRKVLTIEIGDPLERTFHGEEIGASDATETNIYTTMVSDAAKYYGVMLPTENITSGDLEVSVDSIYTHLVPTSQAETPMVDLSVGDVAPKTKIGNRPVTVPQVPSTAAIRVFSASRGTNYVAMLRPYPKPGTVVVDYMAEGKWYRMKDNGKGLLIGEIEGTGSGRINYATGSVTITTGALPDVDTPILISWGNPVEVIDLTGKIKVDLPQVSRTLAESPVAPNSLTITWPVGISDTATATDNGQGVIVCNGEEIGWINYGNGELAFTPPLLPVKGSNYTFDYEKYAPQTGQAAGTNFTLPHPLKPGTVMIDVPVVMGGVSHTYYMRDDGQGHLFAPGWSKEKVATSGSGGGSTSGSVSTGSSTSNTTKKKIRTTVVGGPLHGTVDYITGAGTLDMSKAEGASISVASDAASFKTIKNNPGGFCHMPEFSSKKWNIQTKF